MLGVGIWGWAEDDVVNLHDLALMAASGPLILLAAALAIRIVQSETETR